MERVDLRPREKKMELALSGFLFEDEYSTQSIDMGAFCRLARACGYDGVELRRTQVNPQTPASQRRQVLQSVRDEGLRVICLTARGLPATGPARGAFFNTYLDLCEDLECGLLKIAGDPAWLHQVAGEAESRGVALASNNHIGGKLETLSGTRAHLRAVGHPNYGLLFDPLHLRLSGEDYVACIPELHPFVRNILVHSVRPARPGEESHLQSGGREWMRALPDEAGAQRWRNVFQAFRQQGHDGLVTVIESGWPEDRRQLVAQHCARELRQMWGEV